jgi:glucose/arabinose dehydrogenase
LQLSNVGSAGVQQGIYDITLDPNFSINHYYYLFYTAETPNRDRLSRFTANASLTGTIAGSEVVLYEDPQDASSEHHGGSINFGNDGMIYFTTGEHFGAADAQDLTSPRGKLHRINPDGTVPTDNPFYDGAGPNWDSIWALGLRNPFRAYYDSPTDRLLIADVGGAEHEEVNVGIRGANYGWPNVEGVSSNPAYTNPLYSYSHNGRDASITGGFVYHGTQFPSSYQGSYFFADYAQNWIRRLTFDANGNVTGVFNFEPANGSVDGPVGDIVYLMEGPDGALYYLDLGFSDASGLGVSKLHRIRYTQANLPPVVAASATPIEGANPLTVNFTSAGSSDPEGLPLSYLWAYGDGQTSTAPDPQHTYANAGLYQARLTVSDGVNSTISTPIAINVGNKPVVTVLTTPSSGGLFRAGDVIAYSGQATDIEDGSLSASAFSWTIDFLHEGHVHPGTPITGVTSGSFTIPTSGHDFSGFTRYRITLTVTDSDGLQSSQSAAVFPDKINLTFETAPGGLTLYVDGIAYQGPFVYDTLVGFTHTIEARDQTVSTSTYTFASWSDGGAQSHQIAVPESDQSYLATYQVTQASLAPLDLPSETLRDLRDAAVGAADSGDMLTRLDDFRQRGRFRDITGSGMTAVIIDTGIDVDHPFFGPDADGNGVADRIVFQYDFADHDTDASDRSGHGSHIASLIGSEDLIYPGLAPEADLIALKVFSDTGAGTFANVEQALQWVIGHAAEYSIDVVNLSLGDGRNWSVPGAQYGIGDEFAALANDGIVVVAAAGNNFFTAQSVPGAAYPAADPNVIGVGAVWTQDFGGPWRWSSGATDLTTGPDRIASFSQRDPIMTEVFAPGARLIGANHLGGIVTMQGTSQAAAYLSGTALLAQQLAEKELGRTLTPDEFTRLFTGTGTVILDGDDEQDNVVNTLQTFSRLDVLQLAKGIHRYAAWERGEGGHHSHHGFALAYTQRCWVKDFVAGTAAESAHNEEELLIALPG